MFSNRAPICLMIRRHCPWFICEASVALPMRTVHHTHQRSNHASAYDNENHFKITTSTPWLEERTLGSNSKIRFYILTRQRCFNAAKVFSGQKQCPEQKSYEVLRHRRERFQRSQGMRRKLSWSWPQSIREKLHKRLHKRYLYTDLFGIGGTGIGTATMKDKPFDTRGDFDLSAEKLIFFNRQERRLGQHSRRIHV